MLFRSTDNSDISKDLLEMLGGDEDLQTVVEKEMMQDNKNKTIVTIYLSFMLPPPIYSDKLTVKDVDKGNIGITQVKSIVKTDDGFKITSLQDWECVVLKGSVKFYVEE